MERSYYLVVAKEDDKGSLKLLSLNPHLIFEDETQFDRLPIGEDVPMEVGAVPVCNMCRTPQAIFNTINRLLRPQKLDETLIEQITTYFATCSDEMLIGPEELAKFLNDHIGKFIICVGVP